MDEIVQHPAMIPRPTWPVALLCAIAAATLGVSMRVLAAPAILCTLLLLYTAIGFPRLGKPRTFFGLVEAIPFTLWVRYGSHDTGKMNVEVPVGFLAIIGFYMLTLATHHVLALRRGGSRDYALACATMAMGIAGAFADNPVYFPALAVFGLVMLWHLRCDLLERVPRLRSRRPAGSWVRYTAAIALLLAMTAAVQVLFVRRVPQLSTWAMRALAPALTTGEVGFDRAANLNSVSRIWTGDPQRYREVMLHIFADHPSHYLRAASYDTYERGVWRIVDETHALQPEGTYLGRNLFNLSTTPAKRVAAMVYPCSEMADHFFLPLGTHQVGSFAEGAWYGAAQTIRPDTGGAAGGYAYFDPEVEPTAPNPRDEWVPPRMQRTLRSVLKKAVPENATPRQVADGLTAYFAANYKYKLGVETRRIKDPVVEFLEDLHEGHCEYFAAAGCLLLRAAGVPARYVTGFMVTEQGLGGDLWIARRRDAHAWIEAYLPKTGWTVVDMTPGTENNAERDQTRDAGFGRWNQYFDSQFYRVMQLTAFGGLKALLNAVLDFIVTLPDRLPLWAWFILIGSGAAWVFRADLLRLLRRGSGPALTEHVKELQAKLVEAERLLRRHGLVRPPGTTVPAYLRQVLAAELPQEVRERARLLLGHYIEQRFRRHG
jgi:transglutaminase-like putative cysteine protease